MLSADSSASSEKPRECHRKEREGEEIALVVRQERFLLRRLQNLPTLRHRNGRGRSVSSAGRLESQYHSVADVAAVTDSVYKVAIVGREKLKYVFAIMECRGPWISSNLR